MEDLESNLQDILDLLGVLKNNKEVDGEIPQKENIKEKEKGGSETETETEILMTDFSPQLNQLAQENQIFMGKYSTPPLLTKFEMAALLGRRAKQISQGVGLPPQVLLPLWNDKNNIFCDREIDPLEIAKIELKAGVLPLKIIRQLPNGTLEERPLSSLILPI